MAVHLSHREITQRGNRLHVYMDNDFPSRNAV